MTDPAIEVRGLTKRVLEGVDLAVAPGAVQAVLGPNGAGKTTLLRAVLGLVRPERGSVRLLGREPSSAPPEVRARVAYVPQSAALHGWMTLEEHGRYVAGLRSTWDAAAFDRLTSGFGLDRARPVDDLAASDRQKALLALALASRPEVLVLDEPLSGVDVPARRALLAELIERLAEGGAPITILIATASLGGIERIADHVAILHRGRLLVSGALEAIQARFQRLQLVFEGTAPDDLAIEGARRIRIEGSVATATVEVEGEAHRRRLVGIANARAELLPLGLEDLYLDLVGAEARA